MFSPAVANRQLYSKTPHSPTIPLHEKTNPTGHGSPEVRCLSSIYFNLASDAFTSHWHDYYISIIKEPFIHSINCCAATVQALTTTTQGLRCWASVHPPGSSYPNPGRCGTRAPPMRWNRDEPSSNPPPPVFSCLVYRMIPFPTPSEFRPVSSVCKEAPRRAGMHLILLKFLTMTCHYKNLCWGTQ